MTLKEDVGGAHGHHSSTFHPTMTLPTFYRPDFSSAHKIQNEQLTSFWDFQNIFSVTRSHARGVQKKRNIQVFKVVLKIVVSLLYSFRPLLGPLDGLLHGENITTKETLYNEKNGCLYNLYLIFLWNLPGKLKVSQEPRECVWKKRLFGTFQTFV